MAEKQPAAPAYTVPPLRRSFAALGRSSLRRSSALTVSRMAMRRSDNFVNTTPKLIAGPARHLTVDGALEDIPRPTIRAHRRNHTGERRLAAAIPIVGRRSRNLSTRISVTSDLRGVKRVGRNTPDGGTENLTLLLFSVVNVRSRSLANERKLTSPGTYKSHLKRLRKHRFTIAPDSSSADSHLVSSGQCRSSYIGDTASSFINLQIPRGAFVSPRSGVADRPRKDCWPALFERTEYTVHVHVFATVYTADLVASVTRVATSAHAPRTCHGSHAGGPTRTCGPPIAPQLDHRVSVTLDFRASAGLRSAGTIPAFCIARLRRSKTTFVSRDRARRYSDRETDRPEFSRKSTVGTIG